MYTNATLLYSISKIVVYMCDTCECSEIINDDLVTLTHFCYRILHVRVMKW